MKRYVVGLLFDTSMHNVLLIHKRHGPECTIGKWNGVGGKIEPGEWQDDAMRREFREETGAEVDQWFNFCTLRSAKHEVVFYYAVDGGAYVSAKTCTDEPIDRFAVTELPGEIMHNLRWMIPFLLDDEVTHFIGTVELLREV